MLTLPELQADTVRQCSRCKCQSIDIDAYTPNVSGGWHCPWCNQLVTSEGQRIFLTLMMIFAAILIFIWGCLYIIDLWVTNITNYYTPLNIGLFFLVWPVITVPHSLVMMIGSRILGGRNTMIQYGGLPAWYSRNFGGIHFSIGWALVIPQFVVGWYFPSRRSLTWKILFLQSSIYLTSFIIIAGLSWSIRNISWRTNLALTDVWVIATAFTTILWFTGELKRRDYWLSLLRNEESGITEQHIGGIINYSCHLMRQGKHQDAIELCLDTLQQYPNSILLKIQLSYSYSKNNELELGEKVLSQINNLSEISFFQQAILYNNYGWILWQLDDKTPAQMFIDRAYLLAPWEAAILNSKGWTSVEQGNINQGIELLFQSVERARTPEIKASSLAYAAIGLFRKQSTRRAVETLREAEKIAPQCQTVLNAKSELGYAYWSGE